MLKSLLLPVVGAVILMSAGCAGGSDLPAPVVTVRYLSPEEAAGLPHGMEQVAPSIPSWTHPLERARWLAAQQQQGPSLGHDMAVGAGAVASVEAGKYILSKPKTAVATGEIAAGRAAGTAETVTADGIAERAGARAIADGIGERAAISGGAAMLEEGEAAEGLISILELLCIF
jgi:hypothetical protein